MTIQNVIGGFRTTGVYPFDRSDLSLPQKSNRASLAERTGLGFVPLYSPSHQRQHSRVSVVTFSTEEIATYQRRFEEGYDLPDEKYQKCLSMYHPETGTKSSTPLPDGSFLRQNSPENDIDYSPLQNPSPQLCDFFNLPRQSSVEEARGDYQMLLHTSVLSKLLYQQVPKVKYPETKPKNSAKVLTSSENILRMQEKERRKKELAEEKERKRAECEQKRLKAAEEKQRKMLERECMRLERETNCASMREAMSMQGILLVSLNSPRARTHYLF